MSIIKIYRPYKNRFILQACDRTILAIGNLFAYNIGISSDFLRAVLSCTTEEIIKLDTCTLYTKADSIIIENTNQPGAFVIMPHDYATHILEIWEDFIFGSARTLILNIDMASITCITNAHHPTNVITIN